jgi:hypothetical protein
MNWPKGIETSKQKAEFIQQVRVDHGWMPPTDAEIKQGTEGCMVAIIMLVMVVVLLIVGYWISQANGCADIGGLFAICE